MERELIENARELRWRTAMLSIITAATLGGAACLIYLFNQHEGLPNNTVYAPSEFFIERYTQSYLTPRLNQTIEKQPIKIADQEYAASSIGTHANSSIEIHILKEGSFFSGLCGITDEVGEKGSIKCSILDAENSRELFSTALLRGGMPPVLFKVSIPPSKRLVLKILAGEKSIDFDHAAWVNLHVE